MIKINNFLTFPHNLIYINMIKDSVHWHNWMSDNEPRLHRDVHSHGLTSEASSGSFEELLYFPSCHIPCLFFFKLLNYFSFRLTAQARDNSTLVSAHANQTKAEKQHVKKWQLHNAAVGDNQQTGGNRIIGVAFFLGLIIALKKTLIMSCSAPVDIGVGV